MSRFDEFLTDYARRGKERTATTYFKLLDKFERWLEANNLAQFDRDHVLTFLDESGWSGASKNLFLSALRGWARWEKLNLPYGDWEGDRRLERIASIKDFSINRDEKPALTLEQISDVCTVMDPDSRSLFWILLWFGVRVSELKTVEVDLEGRKLTVQTLKVGGKRTLFFDDYTGKILSAAMDRELIYLPEIAIYKRLRRYSYPIAPIRLTPHICRHTFASHFKRLTDEFTLKRMLGHHYESATDVYVHAFEDEVRELMTEKHYLKPLEAL